MNIDIQPGDLFLEGSDKFGPKIVRFFMTAPNVYIHLWRTITKKQEKVPFYHVGMFISKETAIEQQWKVGITSVNSVINTNKNLLIVRYKTATETQRRKLLNISMKDMGTKWDILNAIGKFLTWITSIPLFARYIQWPKAEICVCRGAYWYKEAFGETFGVKEHSELTTQKMYNYIKANPDKFTIVYKRIKRDELQK